MSKMATVTLLCLLLLHTTAVLGQDDDYYDYSGDYYYYSGDYNDPTPAPATPSPLCNGLNNNYDLCSVWYYGDSKSCFKP